MSRLAVLPRVMMPAAKINMGMAMRLMSLTPDTACCIRVEIFSPG